jgi:hypothetical protein
MFSATSRYAAIETTKYITADGEEIPYVGRRFIPPASNDSPIAEHVVTQGERLDNITASYLGDPEQFWRLCDANNAMQPEELTAEIGRRINIALGPGTGI